MEIIEFKTFQWDEIKHLSKDNIAKKMGIMGIKCTFDYSLSQSWLNDFCIKSGLEYTKVLHSTFTIYPPNNHFGEPCSAWDPCQKYINQYRIEYIKNFLVDKYAEAIRRDLKRLCGIEMKTAAEKLSNDIFKSLNEYKFQWTNNAF